MNAPTPLLVLVKDENYKALSGGRYIQSDPHKSPREIASVAFIVSTDFSLRVTGFVYFKKGIYFLYIQGTSLSLIHVVYC